MSDLSWTEIAIESPAEAENDLAAMLCEAGATGVRVETSPRGLLLRAFFNDLDRRRREEEIGALIRQSQGAVAQARIISVATVSDGRWVERWIAALAPFPVGKRFTVVPIPDLDRAPDPGTEDPPAKGARIPIRICPARAFGTGEHHTTRLCLESLESLPLSGRSLLDVGTGSGILAIAGVKLGCGGVVAIDNDLEAVEVARANVALNGCEGRIALVCGEVESLRGTRYDVVTANLNGFILTNDLPSLAATLAPGGTMIISGLLESEAGGIVAIASALDLRPSRVVLSEGWACILHGAPLE